jgi:hypothetical protein
MKSEKIHPDFDGHLEKTLKNMSPKEKLLYLSQQIELRYFARHVVKKKGKGEAGGTNEDDGSGRAEETG